jgi:hypothetical protein
MARRAFSILLVLPALSLALAAEQQPVSPASPPGTGRIAGRVVGAESGAPVRFAKVTLGGGSAPITFVTEEDGAFQFERLAAGSYTLKIQKAGYLDTVYGQARPGTDTPGATIRLRDREQIDRLSVPLSHGGSIAGVIRDDRGEPAFRASVLLQRWIMRNGVRGLQVVDSTATDERGMYRFSLLPSRQYVVSAAPDDDAIPNGTAGRPPFGFVPMFYPGSTSAQGAAGIALATGEDRANVDLQLPLVALARITGVVVDGEGRPAANVSVSLVDAAGSGDGVSGVVSTTSDGRFAFDRVVPGSYTAVASTGAIRLRTTLRSRQVDLKLAGEISMTFDRLEATLDKKLFTAANGAYFNVSYTPRSEPGGLPGSGSADVTAGSGLESEIVLRLEAPRKVSGRVVFSGGAPRPAFANVEISLTSSHEPAGTFTVNAETDGTFSVPDVPPGVYRVRAQGGGNVWILASAVAAGIETLDRLLDVPRDRDVHDLTMVFAEAGAELAGQALDPSGQPAMDRLVVLFPSEERLWTTSDRRFRSAPLSAAGRYAFDALPPGPYRLALLEGVEPDEWRDPQFLKPLLAASIAITLGEGEKKTQDIRAGGR